MKKYCQILLSVKTIGAAMLCCSLSLSCVAFVKGKADFKIAYEYVKRYEGGYANEPGDPGEITYGGICYKWNKNWYGWKYVLAKPRKRYEIVPEAEFWRQDFFLTIWVREGFMSLNNQVLANYLFDMRINHSKKKTIDLLNKVANTHVINQETWVTTRLDKINLKSLRSKRIEHYHSRGKQKLKNRFLKGWLKRANSQKL